VLPATRRRRSASHHRRPERSAIFGAEPLRSAESATHANKSAPHTSTAMMLQRALPSVAQSPFQECRKCHPCQQISPALCSRSTQPYSSISAPYKIARTLRHCWCRTIQERQERNPCKQISPAPLRRRWRCITQECRECHSCNQTISCIARALRHRWRRAPLLGVPKVPRLPATKQPRNVGQSTPPSLAQGPY
jgi:hypothetical protein